MTKCSPVIVVLVLVGCGKKTSQPEHTPVRKLMNGEEFNVPSAKLPPRINELAESLADLPSSSSTDEFGAVLTKAGLNAEPDHYKDNGHFWYLDANFKSETDPEKLWSYYLQLTEVEAAFKNLKGDLSIRPIYHQRIDRVEAHIFVAFQAYCVHVTLKEKLRSKAPGLTPRQALDKFSGIQMIDAHFPTTEQRELVLSRYTQPEPDHQIVLDQLGWSLPPQPPPKITAKI